LKRGDIMSHKFKSLQISSVAILSLLGLSACGGGGGGGGGGGSSNNFTPPSGDFISPSVSFLPNSLTVESGGTGTSTVTASDNVGVVSGPAVTCTNGGSFSNGVFTAPVVTETTTSICTGSATDAAGNEGTARLTVTIPSPEPDTENPVVTFSPNTLTVTGGQTGSSTLTATDDTVVAEGPTVVCTNNGSFANNTFTAPTVTTQTTSICTATAEDADGNTGEATLSVTINPEVSAFFQTTVDTIATDPILGFLEIPTQPSTLVGLSKSAAGSVSAFAATNTDIGIYDDPTLTPQPTLGTVGTAPLNVLFADVDGMDGGLDDLIFLDEFNDLLVGVPLNADNTFNSPVTRSVGRLCNAGRGSGTRFIGSGNGADPTRDDILVGTTTEGLAYVGAGFANDGENTSGLSSPRFIVVGGNFCSLIVSPTGIGDTTYITYDSPTGTIVGVEGESDDGSSYEEEFSTDISNFVDLDIEPILFDATFGPSSADTVFTVFESTPEAGSTLIISDVGVTPSTDVINLDIEAPTDMLLISRGSSDDAIIVSPTSQYAIYIRDANRTTVSVELIDIGRFGYGLKLLWHSPSSAITCFWPRHAKGF